MSRVEPPKLIPRNATAIRRASASKDRLARSVTGNPVSTRLESGVGNCFPGLECDLRNLERRFFPFLEVDVVDNTILVVSVDLPGVTAARSAGTITAADATSYRAIAKGRWVVRELSGTFGPLGGLTLDPTTLSAQSVGPARRPSDAWTALRLLDEGAPVTVTFRQANTRRTITADRVRYLDENGALAEVFEPGELTQSLCSPWTHDFRDCGCYYWASNHPDIAQPPLPPGVTPGTAGTDRLKPVNWLRVETSADFIPRPASSRDVSQAEFLDYYRINTAWQLLNFVIEGREHIGPYEPGQLTGEPFSTDAELAIALREAAGVELGVIHEYLAAAYSLRDPSTVAGPVGDDIRAAMAEILRISFGEMRHLRAVNDVLLSVPRNGPFVPALRVATAIRSIARPIEPRAATPTTIARFIDIERPSTSVDGLYSRILATLELRGTDEQEQTIRSIMAEGTDHLRTFRFIQEWLGRHAEATYLRPNLQRRNAAAPPPQHVALQVAYRTILADLNAGYAAGLPSGATAINRAREAMSGAGLNALAQAVANAGFLVEFDALPPPFNPLPPPPP